MPEEERIEIVEDVARKLRLLTLETKIPVGVIIVTPYQMGASVCGFMHIYAPTIAKITLANCSGNLAREFEDL